MWIVLNDAFLSVVVPTRFDLPNKMKDKLADPLMVRARRAIDLTRHFPKAHVYHWKARDYPCRIFVERNEVTGAMAKAVQAVDYGNFKNSVREDDRHDAYSAVWGVMLRWQNGGFARRAKFDWHGSLQNKFEFSPCKAVGCTETNPCLDCLTDALPDGSVDRYGDFDEEVDFTAKGPLRIAPK